ncbi:hypothetical protein [Hymenobacter sp. YC55]|uniref:hypothetical protein n=1 Tax=Hymenobacter sp. YC55 TaxID=3034019 RepID=UPI0023F80595|nr:hypothetical protein [Hymenobacter sp. YC55]MDF7815376.1 hypothetical protein [Hymenobacter sp. YC55]
MKPVENILNLFSFTKSENISVYEDFNRFELKIKADKLFLPDSNNFAIAIDELLKISEFRINVSCDDRDSVSLFATSSTVNVKEFLAELAEEIEYDFEGCRFEIACDKHTKQEVVPIFALTQFLSYFHSLSSREQLQLLWKRFEVNQYLAFEILDGQGAEFGSDSIFFLKNRSGLSADEKATSMQMRAGRFNSIRNVCHFESANECQFIPDDFKVTKSQDCPPALIELLNHLCSLVSVVSLFDITRLTKDGLEYKLNGYKSVSDTVLTNQIHSESGDLYYQIYDWVYRSGNLSDKIGLTRNLLSIHLLSTKTLELRGNPFDSIKSSFEIYLKQNIKQYIELRSKISDQIVDQTNKATKIAEEFAGSYKKSIMAFVSFFASIIIAKVFTTKQLNGAFTREATGVALAFLGIATIYFVASYVEFGAEKTRFVKNYQNLKSRFRDLLVEEDINRIVDNDQVHLDDLAYMNAKVKRFSGLWISTILIMLATLFSLSDTYNFASFKKWVGTFSVSAQLPASAQIKKN